MAQTSEPKPFVPLPAQKPATAEVPSHSHAGGKPIISLEKNGEIITHIKITCSCGTVTEIACSY